MWGRIALRGLALGRCEGKRKIMYSNLERKGGVLLGGRRNQEGFMLGGEGGRREGGRRMIQTTSSDSIWKGNVNEGLSEQTVRVGQMGESSPSVLKDWEKYQPENVEKQEEEMRGKQEKAALEYKNARILFNHVWETIEKEWGAENLKFPKEIIWLMGAPGAGKGTNVPFIMEERGITAEPIEISRLLEEDPATREQKEKGWMVNDNTVLNLLLRRLLDDDYSNGAVVDGFPRTEVQVQFIKFLHDKMLELRKHFSASPERHFRRPQFRVCVLFVGEKTSIDRQLERGRRTKEYNEKLASGDIDGMYYSPEEERATDFDPELAKRRYQIFQKHFSTLTSLREHFTFSMIDARVPIADVQNAIKREFEYQSENEIAVETLDAIQRIPLVGEVKQHARQGLIQRLDGYETYQEFTFKQVIDLIEKEIVPDIQLHVFGGVATIRTENPILEDRTCLQMVIDVITERGFHISVVKMIQHVPDRIDKDTFQVVCKEKKVWEFHIRFEPTQLRKF